MTFMAFSRSCRLSSFLSRSPPTPAVLHLPAVETSPCGDAKRFRFEASIPCCLATAETASQCWLRRNPHETVEQLDHLVDLAWILAVSGTHSPLGTIVISTTLFFSTSTPGVPHPVRRRSWIFFQLGLSRACGTSPHAINQGQIFQGRLHPPKVPVCYFHWGKGNCPATISRTESANLKALGINVSFFANTHNLCYFFLF